MTTRNVHFQSYFLDMHCNHSLYCIRRWTASEAATKKWWLTKHAWPLQIKLHGKLTMLS